MKKKKDSYAGAVNAPIVDVTPPTLLYYIMVVVVDQEALTKTGEEAVDLKKDDRDFSNISRQPVSYCYSNKKQSTDCEERNRRAGQVIK